MARDGTGTYSLPQAAFVSGTVISSTAMNSDLSDIASALTQSLSKDGQTTPTANLPMGTYRHTGVGNASARTDYAATGQVQDDSFVWCGTAGGTQNALTLTPSPAITSYATGARFRFKAGASSSNSTVTIAISGLTTKAAQFNDAALSSTSYIEANKYYEAFYDGTAFQLTRLSSSPFASLSASSLTFAATQRVVGRNTAGAGAGEEVTLSQFLDWVGSAAQGDILYRDSSSWSRLAAGTSGNFLKTQGAGANPTWAAAGGITLGTLTTASGTAVQFTGIPSTAKRVTMTFRALSTNTGTTDNFLIQIGPSGGVATSGYVGGAFTTGGNNTGTSGLQWLTNGGARTANGQAIFTLMDAATNLWVGTFTSVDTVGPEFAYGATQIALAGALERIRMTVTGAASFDAGSINIAYE